MAKKKSSPKTTPKSEPKTEVPTVKTQDIMANLPPDLTDEARSRLQSIKTMIDKFQKKVLDKFEDYVLGIALLPPTKPEVVEEVQEKKLTDKEKQELQDNVNVLILIDDADSKKMTKQELKDKLSAIITTMASEVDKNLKPETVIISELWEMCYDNKYDLLKEIAMAAPVYDKGMLAAIKISEIHKTMVLKKFEKYIVTYVLAGSLVQGKATPSSDIDVFVVIDDTDVKKMTRVELKDKLRAIIISMGHEAGKMTGVENKINIQVYILTDFWENIKEANPIIFTFLRDGVPFYDRGIFMPWKQLLKMGRIKPSQEAIDMFMNSGEQMVDRIKLKMKEIGVEDFFWATQTPSQAAIMLYGVPPPTPKETPGLLRDLFVKKEKILEEKYVKIFENILKTRKAIEHGTKKTVTGAELDELLQGTEEYLKRLKTLFNEIETLKERESVVEVYDGVVTVVRDVLSFENVKAVKDDDIEKTFQEVIVDKGILPAKTSRMLKSVCSAKKEYDAGKLTKAETNAAKKESRDLFKILVEHIQRRRGQELERTKIRVKHGSKYGEIIMLDKEAFIIHDVDASDKEITRAPIKEDGSLGKVKASSLAELEHALSSVSIPPRAFIKQPIFDNLLDIFGEDVEVLINY